MIIIIIIIIFVIVDESEINEMPVREVMYLIRFYNIYI